MEIDELKHIWRQVTPGDTPAVPGAFERAVARSRVPLRKMRRNVVRQAVVLVACYAFAFFLIQARFRLPVGVLYATVILASSVYYRRKYMLLKSMEGLAGADLLTAFRGKLQLLRRYLRFYSATKYYLLPLAMGAIVCILWFYERTSFYRFLWLRFHTGQEGLVLACWALCTVLLALPSGYLSDLWIYREFGRHVAAIEADLRELEDAPENGIQ